MKLADKESLRKVSLHHLIRQNGNPMSKKIKEFDRLFAKNMYTPRNISDQQIADYMKIIADAEAAELPKYDIILCTCTTSSQTRLHHVHGAKIVQCIIDECGMCTEPESLIPLVKHNPEQVVLIGDHKQLAPIVLEHTAKKLGLSVSLFERYAKKAIMLDTQYRMVRIKGEHENYKNYCFHITSYTKSLTTNVPDQVRVFHRLQRANLGFPSRCTCLFVVTVL